MPGMSTVRIVNEAIRLIEELISRLPEVTDPSDDIDDQVLYNLEEMRILSARLYNSLPVISR